MAFSAAFDRAASVLKLSGPAGMADAPALSRELDHACAAAPPAVRVDLSGAGEFDIGPAWLLQDALDRLRRDGSDVVIDGAVPEHFAYFRELVGREGGALPAAAPPGLKGRLAEIGRALEERGSSWYQALVFGVSGSRRWCATCTRPACRRSRSSR
jgi:ABC-type transporter Mla MlaB component